MMDLFIVFLKRNWNAFGEHLQNYFCIFQTLQLISLDYFQKKTFERFFGKKKWRTG